MDKSKKIKIFKIAMLILAVVICVGITIYLFPLMKKLATPEGQIEFKEKIQGTGFYGIALISLLQIAQIFLFILPGEPIEILAGMCYGGIGGTVLMMVSSAIVATIILLLVKKFGKDFIYEFCDKEKVKKIEESKLYNNPKKIETIMFIAFFIPGTPKDLLTYIAGLLPIKTWRFVLITTIARIPSIITSTIVGANITDGNWKLGVLIYAIILAVVAIIVFIYNKFDKDKTTKSILTSLK